MMRTTNTLSKIIARTLAVAMVNGILPFGFAGVIHDPLKPELPDAKPKVAAPSRLLSGNEQKKLQGKWAQNPYLAGSSKMSVNMHDVDLMTRNFSQNVTDLDFQGGYGIPRRWREPTVQTMLKRARSEWGGRYRLI